MIKSRQPHPSLAPFVRTVWATEDVDSSDSEPGRERMLPTGEMHVAFRLGSMPFRFYGDSIDLAGEAFGHAVIGGPRVQSCVRELARQDPSVGALLRPGAAELLFGVPSVAFAGQHVPLNALWSASGTAEALDRLHGAINIDKRLTTLEAILLARLPAHTPLHPAVAFALRELPRRRIGDVVERAGYSHRHFIDLFRRQVGLSPRDHCRIERFQQAIRAAHRRPSTTWAEVALAAGYSDQPHFNREFRTIAGVTPGTYRRLVQRPGHLACVLAN